MTGASAEAEGRRTALSRAGSRGMAVLTIAEAGARLISIVAQVALGWLLAPATFGVLASVAVALSVASGFQNTGAMKLLVQQRAAPEVAARLAAFSVAMSLLGTLAVLAAGVVLAALHRDPLLAVIVAVGSAQLVPSILRDLDMARLSTVLRFGWMAWLGVAFAAVHHGLMIGFAALGARGFTSALALTGAAIIQGLLARRAAGPLAVDRILDRHAFLGTLHQLRWMVGGGFLGGISQTGDYLALGFVLDRDDLGQYFFGFAVVASAAAMIAPVISRALLPVFAGLSQDTATLRAEVMGQAARTFLVAQAVGVLIVALVAPAMTLVWGVKWEPAQAVAVLVGAALPFRILGAVGSTAVESLALWRRRMLVLGLEATLLVAAATAGGLVGGLWGAALAVGVQQAATGTLSAASACAPLGIRARAALAWLARTATPYLAAAAAAAAMARAADHPVIPVMAAATGVAVLVLGWRIAAPEPLADLGRGLAGLLRRRRA